MKKLLEDNDLGLPLETETDRTIVRVLKAVASINSLNKLYATTHGTGAQFAQSALDALKITTDVSQRSMENLPSEGAFIAVANLPHGIADGLALMAIIVKKRPDTKFVTGFVAAQIEAIRQNVIDVDNFESSSESNFKGVRKAKNHLDAGHPLIIFPSMRLATFTAGRARQKQDEWSEATVKFIMHSNAPVIPVHISGRNSLTFRFLGRINRKLQMVRMGHELLATAGHELSIEIGAAVGECEKQKLETPEQFEAYLRANLTVIGSRSKIDNRTPSVGENGSNATKSKATTIEKLTIKQIEQHLTPQNYLLTLSQISFYAVQGQVIQEIIENQETQQEEQAKSLASKYIVGFEQDSGRGVCMAEIRYGDRSMLEHGIDGLYTSQFFEYSHKYFDTIRRSIELGEREVSEKYRQNKDLSTLIWRSALTLLAREEQYRYLIGTSGIAADYSTLAKLMIATYIHTHAQSKSFARMAVARHSAKRFHKQLFEGGMIEQLKDMDLANKLISDSDPVYNEMPRTLEALLRHDAHVLALSTNHKEKNKLNALMIMDIEEVRQNVPRGTMRINSWL